MRSGVVECGTGIPSNAVSAGFDGQRALPHGGAHGFGRQNLGDASGPTQALQSGGREHNSGILAFVEFAQARIEIAAYRFDDEVGTQSTQLGSAAKRTGSNGSASGQIG